MNSTQHKPKNKALSTAKAFLYAKARADHPEMSQREISQLVRQWLRQYKI